MGHDAVMAPWLKQYLAILKQYYPHIQTDNIKTTFIPRWKVSLQKCEEKSVCMGLTDDIYFAKGAKDHFIDSTLFELEKNVRTTDETHFQVCCLLLSYFLNVFTCVCMALSSFYYLLFCKNVVYIQRAIGKLLVLNLHHQTIFFCFAPIMHSKLPPSF